MKLVQRIRKALESFSSINERDSSEDFPNHNQKVIKDTYLQHAWVSIAIDILIRNIGRTSYNVKLNNSVTTTTPSAKLFEKPNQNVSCFDLWKQTAAWWSLEGEAFWYFGNDYTFGVPSSLTILNPRLMNHEISGGKIVRWLYEGDEGQRPFTILSDEVVHFKDWNPWNRWRGVCPLVSLAMEIEQDVLAGKSNTDLLKEGGIPKGLLKTDQIIREEEADQIEKRWESRYGKGTKRKIAVIGKGTSYQQLTLNPDVLKLFDIKKWNLYTILAKYGIPPRVANIHESKSSLSGTDTREQHAALWKYTLIPMLKNFEQIANVQFFDRLRLQERGSFDISMIPELQESEDEQSKRDIEEINAGLITINDVLKKRGLPPKPWGDTWWRPNKLVGIEENKHE